MTTPTTPSMTTVAPPSKTSDGPGDCASGVNLRPRRMWHRIPAIATLAAAVVISEGAAIAQEFVKVDDAAREQLPATPFVGVAYGFIWVAILGYLFIVARGLGRLQRELRELRRRIDRAGGEGPGAR